MARDKKTKFIPHNERERLALRKRRIIIFILFFILFFGGIMSVILK